MSLRQTLLPTPPERVSAELAARVAAFCSGIPEIRSAFVWLTETHRDFDFPTQQLSVAFELAAPTAQTAEGDRELRLVADRFYDTMPEDVQAGGCNFLEPGGIAAWEEKAQRVYPAAASPAP